MHVKKSFTAMAVKLFVFYFFAFTSYTIKLYTPFVTIHTTIPHIVGIKNASTVHFRLLVSL